MAQIIEFKCDTAEFIPDPQVTGFANPTDTDFLFGTFGETQVDDRMTVIAIYSLTTAVAGEFTVTLAARGPVGSEGQLPPASALSMLSTLGNGSINADALALPASDAVYSIGQLFVADSNPLDECATWTWTVTESLTELVFENFGLYTATIATSALFNCECADAPDTRTLLDLRSSLMRRLGFAVQVDNPPPGMTELLNDFLQDAQRQLYRRFNSLHTERFFKWDMEIGNRFYGMMDNSDTCVKRLDAYKVTWVGIEDANNAWYELDAGIDPVLYTMNKVGIPYRYEIRQCIEVWPAPSTAYTLWIKGHFGLLAFAADEDVSTIDSDLIFLHALANAKAHYGQADANNYFNQLNSTLGALVAGSHLTARYVTGARPYRPLVQPVMLPGLPGS